MDWTQKSFSKHRFDEEDYLQTHIEKFKVLAGMLSRRKPIKILDLGAGTGTIYSLLPTLAGLEIHAIEIVEDFVNTLEERGIQAHIFDLDKGEPLPFPNHYFDVILCDSILEHTLKPRFLFEESKRLLKKGGHLILVVPNATSIRRRWDHFRGRNIFYPLIDNLFTRSYLQRCSIFYSQSDLEKYSRSFFGTTKFIFIDETRHDQKKVITRIFRMLSARVTNLRDVIIMVCTKE